MIGTWERIHTTLREKTRLKQGRKSTPSAAIIDSQSVKTSQKGGCAATGAAKKVKGRKRHILVDTNGWMMHVLDDLADIQDHEGGNLLLAPLQGRFPRLKLIWVDRAYKKGDCAEWENRAVWRLSGGGGAPLEWAARRLGLRRGGH